MKEDFKNVLQASVQKQWDEVRRAMAAFTYFDALDEVNWVCKIISVPSSCMADGISNRYKKTILFPKTRDEFSKFSAQPRDIFCDISCC